MTNTIRDYLQSLKTNRLKRRRAGAVLLALSLVVATGVTWQLHLTGITLTGDAYCGCEEHQHDESCYEKQLVCGLEESEGHTHSVEAGCYEEQQTLICTIPAHTHGDGCYDADGNLVCQTAEHTHTDECYEEVLVCGKTEHVHTLACYSNSSADTETSADWEAALPALTDDWADNVVAIAQSQLGYQESDQNYKVETDADGNEVKKGYTRYGAWYGNEYGDWCGMFASFCIHYAGIDQDTFPYAAGCQAWVSELTDRSLYAANDSYTPEPGDLVFFDNNDDGQADHVGIVESASESDISVIEGNSGNAVQRNTYSIGSDSITGYGILPENPNQETEEPTETAAEGTTEEQTATEETAEEITETTDGALPAGSNDIVVYAEVTEQNASGAKVRRAASAINALSDDASTSDDVSESDDTSINDESSSEDGGVSAQTTEGSISEKLTSATIKVDGTEYDGTSKLDPNSSFSVELAWSLTRSDLEGTGLTWTYTFPEQITVQNVGETVLTDSAGNRKGVYSITDGVLTVTYDNAADKLETVFEVNASWNSEKIQEETEIKWNDQLKTTVQLDTAQLSVTKAIVGTSDLADGSYIGVFEATMKARSAVTDATLTDTLQSATGKFKFYQDCYTDKDGQKRDYQCTITNADGTTEVIYGDYTVTTNADGTQTFTIPGINLSAGQTAVYQYGVIMSADDRFTLDQNQTSEKITNTATGSFQKDDDTVTSSSTVTTSYKAKNQWVVKEKGDGATETDIPWKVNVNPDRSYGMGGAVISDAIQTTGVYYETDKTITVTKTTGKSSSVTSSSVNATWKELTAEQWSTMESKSTDAEKKTYVMQVTGISESDMESYVFVNADKTSFVWFSPEDKDTDGNLIPYTYTFEYITDASRATDDMVKNQSSASWKEWKAQTTIGTWMREVELVKSNDGVRKGTDGNYYVDWTITLTVPKDRDAVEDVFLYDTLSGHTFGTVQSIDWLVGLSSDTLDASRAGDADYLSELTRGAFSITTDSTDETVQNLVKDAMTSLGPPTTVNGGYGLHSKNKDYSIFSGDLASVGQLKLNGQLNDSPIGDTVSATKFGIALGTLPETRTRDGYTITIKYTTQVNPYTVEQAGTKPVELVNTVELYHLKDKETANFEKMGTATAPYTVARMETEDSLTKQVASYDASTNTVTYQVQIDPLRNLSRGASNYTMSLKLADVLSVPGAIYVENSFALSFTGTASTPTSSSGADYSVTYDPNGSATVLYRSTEGWNGGGANEVNAIWANAIKGNLNLTVDNQTASSSSFEMTLSKDLMQKLYTTSADGSSQVVLPMTLTYQVKLPEGSAVPDSGTVQNTVTLNYHEGSKDYYIDDVTSKFEFDTPLHKVLTTNPNSTNGYNATFTIDVDPTDKNWPEDGLKDGKFTVSDTMSKSLQLLVDTVKVYGIDSSGTAAELDSSAYTASYDERDESLNVLSVQITKLDQYEKYRVVYTTHVSGAENTRVTYDNVAQIDGTDVKSEEIEKSVYIQKQQASVTETNYKVTLNKYAADDISKKLEATFTLYAWDSTSNTWISRATGLKTDSTTGQLVIDNATYSGSLTGDTWYKLVETSAPQDYLKGTTYFYLEDKQSPGTPPEGVSSYQTFTKDSSTGIIGGTLQVPNYKATIRLKKVASDDTSKGLPGAVFALYSSADCSGTALATATSSSTGSVEFQLTGLTAGITYYLKETKAPDGYNLADTVFTVTFDAEGNVTLKNGDTTVTAVNQVYQITNAPGYELPDMGGSGTLPYVLIGSLLIAAAVVYGYKRRRTERRVER